MNVYMPAIVMKATIAADRMHTRCHQKKKIQRKSLLTKYEGLCISISSVCESPFANPVSGCFQLTSLGVLNSGPVQLKNVIQIHAHGRIIKALKIKFRKTKNPNS